MLKTSKIIRITIIVIIIIIHNCYNKSIQTQTEHEVEACKNPIGK